MKVGLLLIATNKYTRFLQNLITSADKWFLPNGDVTYFIFSDQNMYIKSKRAYKVIPTEHKPWPWMTLGRYDLFTKNRIILSDMNYLYYCDVDMRFDNTVGDEILGDLVATQHPLYAGTRGTPETRPESLAFVSPSETMQYFAGGFNGGSVVRYLNMAQSINKNILEDYSKGIIAIWHDESHLNRFLIDNPPTKILDRSYCFPEEWLSFSKARLVALNKNHKEMRS